MTSKLTLSINQEVIEKAKYYARKKGRSLSGLVENYLKALGSNDPETGDFSPKVKRLLGAVKLPDDFDYKKSVREEIENKHGR